MKTRKINRKKRVRRNKTIRGGDTPPINSLPHSNSISLSVSPSRADDLKNGDFLDKNDTYLEQILEFTNTTKEEFVSLKKKRDIKKFFEDNLKKYLQTPQFVEYQLNILNSYLETDDFDVIMAKYVDEEEAWFSPRRH